MNIKDHASSATFDERIHFSFLECEYRAQRKPDGTICVEGKGGFKWHETFSLSVHRRASELLDKYKM